MKLIFTAENQGLNAASENKKPLARNVNLILTRMDWENHLEKKSDQKNRKNSKNQSEIAACEQKPLVRKRIFVQTPLSL